VLQETQDDEEIIERIAALDVGKAELVCCARVPGEGKRGRRVQGGTDVSADGPVPVQRWRSSCTRWV
jgi:hypothetical protein